MRGVVGSGGLILQIEGVGLTNRLVGVASQKWWDVKDRPHKHVGDGRLASKTGVRWDVETPATPPASTVALRTQIM